MADRKKKTSFGLKFLLFTVFWVFIFLSVPLYHLRQAGRLFRENYNQLKVGTSKEYIKAMWGAPEYTISVVDGKKLWSYKNESHPTHIHDRTFFFIKTKKRKEPAAGQAVSLEEMGSYSTYSNAELLFDDEGTLEAYTKVGEESAVHTKYGDISGSGWYVYSRFLNERDQRRSED
jgi:hypothetical protein